MIVKIYHTREYVPGAGREDFYSFLSDEGDYFGHVDTGNTSAELKTDEDGETLLYLGDEADGYTAGQIVANCAAHRHGIYFHQY